MDSIDESSNDSGDEDEAADENDIFKNKEQTEAKKIDKRE